MKNKIRKLKCKTMTKEITKQNDASGRKILPVG